MVSKVQKPLLIGVMGLTGSGKSNFINRMTGDENIKVGDGEDSCTQSVDTCSPFTMDGHTIQLVDTPGFSDTTKSDTDVLKMIANWLKESYDDDMKLHGIVYLHDISTIRMHGGSVRSLNVFRNICGENYLANTMLVTTMWDTNPSQEQVFLKRAERLKAGHWKNLIAGGAMYERSDNTKEKFREIISQIVAKAPNQPKLQEEMGEGKKLNETVAGAGLETEVTALLAKQQEALDELAEQNRQTAASNVELKEQLAEDMRAHQAAVEKSQADLRELGESLQKTSNKKDLDVIRKDHATWAAKYKRNEGQPTTVTRSEVFEELLAEITAIKSALSRLPKVEIEGFHELFGIVECAEDGAVVMSRSEEERVRVDKTSLSDLRKEHLAWSSNYQTLLTSAATTTRASELQILKTKLLDIEKALAKREGRGIGGEKELVKLVNGSKAEIADSVRSETARLEKERTMEETAAKEQRLFNSVKDNYDTWKFTYTTKLRELATSERLHALEALQEALIDIQNPLSRLEGKDVAGRKELVTKVNGSRSEISQNISNDRGRLESERIEGEIVRVAQEKENDRVAQVKAKKGKQEQKVEALRKKFNSWVVAIDVYLKNPQHSLERTNAFIRYEKEINAMRDTLDRLEEKDIHPRDNLATQIREEVIHLEKLVLEAQEAQAKREIEKEKEKEKEKQRKIKKTFSGFVGKMIEGVVGGVTEVASRMERGMFHERG